MDQYLARLKDCKPGMRLTDVLTSDYLNAINGAIRALARGENVKMGFGVKKQSGSDWFMLTADESKRSRKKEVYPWDMNIGVAPGGDLQVQVAPGLINSGLPLNMYATLNCPAMGTKYLVAVCQTNGRQVVSALLEFENAQPAIPLATQEVAPSVVKLALGVIVDSTPFNLWKKNVSVIAKEIFREPKANPQPFEIPYKSWWSWQFF